MSMVLSALDAMLGEHVCDPPTGRVSNPDFMSSGGTGTSVTVCPECRSRVLEFVAGVQGTAEFFEFSS